MSSLADMLSRLWRALCDVTRKEPQEETAKEAPGENKANDLTVIRGIGIVTQDQLYKAARPLFSQNQTSAAARLHFLGQRRRSPQKQTPAFAQAWDPL